MMMRPVLRRVKDLGGRSRIVVVLLLLIVVMIGIIGYPLFEHYRWKEQVAECEAALNAARRQMTTDQLLSVSWSNYSSQDALNAIKFYGRDNLCPYDGTVFVVEKGDVGNIYYDLVCGLHGEDTKLSTKLSASYVLGQVESALPEIQRSGELYPESISTTLHNQPLTVQLVDAEVPQRRGTADTADQEGIVAFYSVAGYGSFPADPDRGEGAICYFCFADEDHYAIWSTKQGWTGDCYQ